MAEAEGFARENKRCTLHLFTNDKVEFYSHLGYTNGPAITTQKPCTAKLDFQQVSAICTCDRHR